MLKFSFSLSLSLKKVRRPAFEGVGCSEELVFFWFLKGGRREGGQVGKDLRILWF